MTIKAEFVSWFLPVGGPTAQAPPRPGDRAPITPKLELAVERPSIMVFLRHCGCPFSEQSYLNLREAAKSHTDIDFIVISHSDDAATSKWLESLPKVSNEPHNLRLVVDDNKEIYAAWGLGAAGLTHVINPTSLVRVIKLSAKGGISARGTDSGSRWQTSGHYAVNGDGVVTWGAPARRADDIINIDEALQTLNAGKTRS